MKALGITRADKNYIVYAKRVETSFRYFHPEIEFITLQAEDYMPAMKMIFQFPFGFTKFSKIFSVFVAYWKMMTEHYDLVMHFDADVVITGRLDEMLEADFEVATSESTSNDFPNSGVWATTSSQFLLEFFLINMNSITWDNGCFVWTSKRYKTKCLDGKDSNVWYNERGRAWWDQLRVEDDKLWTPDRQVKVLHWAGGLMLNGEKTSCSLFSEEVKQWLDKITDTKDFTTNEGNEFGQWLSKHLRK